MFSDTRFWIGVAVGVGVAYFLLPKITGAASAKGKGKRQGG